MQELLAKTLREAAEQAHDLMCSTVGRTLDQCRRDECAERVDVLGQAQVALFVERTSDAGLVAWAQSQSDLVEEIAKSMMAVRGMQNLPITEEDCWVLAEVAIAKIRAKEKK